MRSIDADDLSPLPDICPGKVEKVRLSKLGLLTYYRYIGPLDGASRGTIGLVLRGPFVPLQSAGDLNFQMSSMSRR